MSQESPCYLILAYDFNRAKQVAKSMGLQGSKWRYVDTSCDIATWRSPNFKLVVISDFDEVGSKSTELIQSLYEQIRLWIKKYPGTVQIIPPH